ncbi:MAG: SUF system Fe-S cluster assembly regulator [Thalassolituus oleivorans]|uniref:SUF system Fe-S cluster assembly regulator n=1 Tax=Thalassolituus oleivorans TaxID=187493 RepID=UPI001B66D443|nr:SUF system Fe-S cluster assembly regulator [Thalassolituus oleivorans]MBQ0728920.1 SUF system Fe-S cluster assembly regulator [Thalassolituus oleivorans]MBQ0779550.1 SUF system Fe-S cluster assembly regulator [Thalassolituus oleivorans]
MLKISKLTDYGIVVLNHLAQSASLQQSTDDIGLATGLATATVRKVMKALADAGLVITRRGARGGYRLARSPLQVSVLDVVEAFEGPVALTECSTDDHHCDITENCSLASNWGGINQLLMQVLSRVTLEDLRNPQVQDRLYRELVQQSPRIQLLNL